MQRIAPFGEPAIGLWADVERQVATFGYYFYQDSHQLTKGLVVIFVAKGERSPHCDAAFPRNQERAIGDSLLWVT